MPSSNLIQYNTQHNEELTMYQLDSTSHAAFTDGVDNGTIRDTEQEVVQIILDQEVVSYCSKYGCYTFDIYDLTEA